MIVLTNHKNVITGFQMLLKCSAFDEEKLRELIDFYVNDVDNFDWVKSEVILLNRYLDDCNIKQNSAVCALVYFKDDFADVVHLFNCRQFALTNDVLDPCHYITSPSLSFDVKKKLKKIQLELMTDYEMTQFVIRNIHLKSIFNK